MEAVEIEDFGSMTIQPLGKNQSGESFMPVTIDVAEGAERFSRAVREANGDELVYAERLREAMQAMGFPPMSHHANHFVAQQIWDRNGEVEKKYAAIRQQGVAHGSQTTTE